MRLVEVSFLVGLLACGTACSATSSSRGSASGGAGADGGSGIAGGGGDGGSGTGSAPTPVSVDLQFVGKGSGRVTSSPPGIDCPGACSMTVPAGTGISLVAAPEASSTFVGWGGACSGTTCRFAADRDGTVWANFEVAAPSDVTLTVSLAGSGSGRITSAPAGIDCPGTCAMKAPAGSSVTFTAAPADTSSFAAWSGACSGTGACVVAARADASLQARFDLKGHPPPDDCAGLLPADPGAPGASHSIAFGNPAGVPFCMPGFVDGDGTLALDLWDGRPGYGRSIDFVSPSGTTLSSIGNGGQSVLTEQADGFLALNFSGGGSWWVSRLDSRGQEKARTSMFNEGRGMAVDPTGGAVVPRIGLAPSGATTSLELFSYDAHLAPRWHAVLPAESLAGLAVDRAGNTLVVFDGDDHYGPDTVAAVWVDHDGAVGPEFELLGALPSGSAAHLVTFTLAERVGSGLFVGAEGTWRTQVATLSTKPAAPPAWLASRPLSSLHMIHSGQGYAVLPNPASGDCAQAIEVVSATGKTCGSQTFRAAAGTCNTSWIRVGYDGTVVQNAPQSPACSGRTCSCSWQWWSAFYR